MHGLQQYVAFAETARHGSFASAARALGTVPSTLAKAVARLEAELGVRLFHRTTRQVTLTPDGERLYAHCQRLLAEVEDLRAEAAGTRMEPSGTLRVNLPICYGKQVVMPVLARLVQRHPVLRLDVRLQDGLVDLVQEGIDLAVRVGRLEDSSLVARRIDWQVLVLCASPAYLAACGVPGDVAALAAHAAIAFRMPSTGRSRPWQFREGERMVEMAPPQVVGMRAVITRPARWRVSGRRSMEAGPLSSLGTSSGRAADVDGRRGSVLASRPRRAWHPCEQSRFRFARTAML